MTTLQSRVTSALRHRIGDFVESPWSMEVFRVRPQAVASALPCLEQICERQPCTYRRVFARRAVRLSSNTARLDPGRAAAKPSLSVKKNVFPWISRIQSTPWDCCACQLLLVAERCDTGRFDRKVKFFPILFQGRILTDPWTSSWTSWTSTCPCPWTFCEPTPEVP